MIVVNNTEILYEQCKGRSVYVYGAKTIAQRACYFLESRGIKVEAFLVSNRYENPDSLHGKPVFRIEDIDRKYDCVVVAVSGALVWKVEQEIEQYNIDKIVVINPLMDDAFPACQILSKRSFVSDRAFLLDDVQLISDESSSIVIEDNVVIKSGTVILATGGSNVHIGKCCSVGELTTINGNLYMATRNSEISIGTDCMLSFYVKMNVGSHVIVDQLTHKDITNYNKIIISDHVWIGMGVTLLPGCNIGSGSVIGASALVNKSIPMNVTCVGISARIVKTGIEWDRNEHNEY